MDQQVAGPGFVPRCPRLHIQSSICSKHSRWSMPGAQCTREFDLWEEWKQTSKPGWREERQAVSANLTISLSSILARHVMCSGRDGRQLFINKFKHFVCHQKESLTVSSLRNAKSLEMDHSQVLCFFSCCLFSTATSLPVPWSLAEDTAGWLLSLDPLSLILPTELQLHSFASTLLCKALCIRVSEMCPQPRQMTTA